MRSAARLPQSDLDLAVMADEMPGAEALRDLGSRLARIVGCPVDLLDLRVASTVMQYRIVTTGQRLYKSPATFAADHTRQDAAILNVQRACEAALDMGQHLIRRERLGVPQSSRDVFALLARPGGKLPTPGKGGSHGA